MLSGQTLECQGLPVEYTRFEHCVFVGLSLLQADLSGYEFTDCTFKLCDLSMVRLDGAVLHGIRFENCKLLGVDFSKISRFMFSVGFVQTILDYAQFHKTTLKKTRFDQCSLREAIFAEADLSEVQFIETDLTDASFDRCNLQRADFCTAINFALDPSHNKVKNARFSVSGLVGLVKHLGIEIDEV